MRKHFMRITAVTTVVALILSLMMLPVSATTTPTNLMPEDVFSSPEKATEWFGKASTDTNDYTKDGDDYVMHVPWVVGSSVWLHSKQEIPYDSYTVKMEIQPIEGVDDEGNPRYYGVGILLGYGDGNTSAFPWFDCRFDFNYDFETVDWYIWEHLGGPNAAVKNYGSYWYENWEFSEDLWFEVIFEITPEETRIFLDGYEVPAMDEGYTIPAQSIGHYPTSQDIQWIGFFPQGGNNSTGFNVKNMGIYEGINLGLGKSEATEEPTQEPTDVSTERPTEESTQESSANATQNPTVEPTDKEEDDTQDGSSIGLIIGIIAAVIVIGAATVVVIRKKYKK